MNKALTGFLLSLLLALNLAGEESLIQERAQLFEEINRFRAEQGLKTLQEDPLLNRCAADYAGEMLEYGYMGHVDRHGNRALQRYRNLGGTATRVGENLASLATESPWSKLLTLWIESPTHLEVLKQEDWLTLGIALMELDGKRVGIALFSNSLVLIEQDKCIFTTNESHFLSIPSEGILQTIEKPVLDLSLYRAPDWRLLEIRDSQQALHNRILLSPADYREDSE